MVWARFFTNRLKDNIRELEGEAVSPAKWSEGKPVPLAGSELWWATFKRRMNEKEGKRHALKVAHERAE